ncbi:hypothetical protein GCM10027614_43980 [Micromonospora vulcania]
MGATHRGVAAGALAAAGAVHTLQGGGEGAGRHRTAGAGRAREDPGVGHPGGRIHPVGRGGTADRSGGDQRGSPVGRASAQYGGRRGGGPAQRLDRLVLTDQVGEDVRHQGRCSIVTSSASDNSGCTEVSGP